MVFVFKTCILLQDPNVILVMLKKSIFLKFSFVIFSLEEGTN